MSTVLCMAWVSGSLSCLQESDGDFARSAKQRIFKMSKSKKEFPRRDKKNRIKENIYMTVFHNDDKSMDLESRLLWIKNNAKAFCIALHDKDFDPDGVFVDKPHTHVYFQFENTRVLDCVADNLKVNAASIEAVDLNRIGGTPAGIIQYYAHRTAKAQEPSEKWPFGKIGYVWQFFDTNIDIAPYFVYDDKKLSQSDKINMISDFIFSNMNIAITYRKVTKFARENDCISELIRGSSWIARLVEEQNKEFYNAHKQKKHIAISYKKGRGKVVCGSVFHSANYVEF